MGKFQDFIEKRAISFATKTRVIDNSATMAVFIGILYVAVLCASAYGSVNYGREATSLPIWLLVIVSVVLDLLFSLLVGMAMKSIKARNLGFSFVVSLVATGLAVLIWNVSTSGNEEHLQNEVDALFVNSLTSHHADSLALANVYDAKIDSLEKANSELGKVVALQRMEQIEGNNKRIESLAQEKIKALESFSTNFWTINTIGRNRDNRRIESLSFIIEIAVVINLLLSLAISYVLVHMFKESEAYQKHYLRENAMQIKLMQDKLTRQAQLEILKSVEQASKMMQFQSQMPDMQTNSPEFEVVKKKKEDPPSTRIKLKRKG